MKKKRPNCVSYYFLHTDLRTARSNLHELFLSNFFEQTFNFTENKYPDMPFHPHFPVYFERTFSGLAKKTCPCRMWRYAGIW